MPRKPDEIKKGLECCAASIYQCADDCPYRKECRIGQGGKVMKEDAIALIQRLQAENAEKDKRIRQLERSLSFARDLADGLKAATVKQEQELYVSEERNRQLETQNAEQVERIKQLEADKQQLEGMLTHMNQLRDAAAGRALKMEERVRQLEAERDALMHYLRSMGCDTCLYDDYDGSEPPCINCTATRDLWQFQGVQKEDGNASD